MCKKLKDWVKEVILGVVFLAFGVVFTKKFLNSVLLVIKGLIGPLLLFLGLIFLWIGIEDKKLEKELEELEKELEKEEVEEKTENKETNENSN